MQTNEVYLTQPYYSHVPFEILDCELQITELNIQLNNIVTILGHSKHNHTKWGLIHSLFDFLFGTSINAEEIAVIKIIWKYYKETQISEAAKFQNFLKYDLHWNWQKWATT